eukprot:7323509-Prymnesium_polylepis.1
MAPQHGGVHAARAALLPHCSARCCRETSAGAPRACRGGVGARPACLWIFWMAAGDEVKRVVSFMSALTVNSFVVRSATGERSTAESKSTTCAGSGDSAPSSGGGIEMRSSPYSPTHQTESCISTGWVLCCDRGT